MGDRLGPYFLQRVAGSGGMGRVFRAVHERLLRPVAIKVMFRAYATGDGPRRFLREARAVNKVYRSRPHENLVEITDIYEAPPGQVCYYVMEWLEGYSLQERRTQCGGFIPIAELLDVFTHVADALDAVHRAGIVHRDLKPENVFLVDLGAGRRQPKVIDFGVALDQHEPDPDPPGHVMGTLAYLSPEQLTGSTPGTPQTDIYAFGVMLYELCTGQLPFPGPSAEDMISQRLAGPPPAPAAVCADNRGADAICMELEAVILRCLAQRPAERYATMAELRDALRALPRGTRGSLGLLGKLRDLRRARRVLAGPPKPPTALERDLAARRRKRLRLRLLKLGLCALALGGLYLSRDALRETLVSYKDSPLLAPLLRERKPPQPEEPMALEVQLRTVPPGAEVRYGGALLCRTPCVARLPEGQREIELRRPGYRSERRALAVRVGLSLNLKLTPLSGARNKESHAPP